VSVYVCVWVFAPRVVCVCVHWHDARV